MKKLLTNLLLVLAAALCALCVAQWTREVRLRQEFVATRDRLQRQLDQTAQLEGSLKRADTEVVRLDARVTELKQTGATNTTELATLRRDWKKSVAENDALKLRLAGHTTALARQNDAIRQQNRDLEQLNAALKRVAEERNEWARKYEASVKQHNEVVLKHNAVVMELEQTRARLDAALTNAPSKPNP